MKAVITHYGDHDLKWLTDFTSDYVIYDRSNSGLPGAIPRENVGDCDYDKLTYIIDNYDDLPDVFLLSKSNLFKFITPEEWDEVKNSTEFTPVLTKNHKTYEDKWGPVCYYSQGIYWERNDSWYLNSVPSLYFKTFGDYAKSFRLPNPKYLPFAPGGSYILTRGRVHRYALDFYKELREILPYCAQPGEAHLIERTYGMLWGDYSL